MASSLRYIVYGILALVSLQLVLAGLVKRQYYPDAWRTSSDAKWKLGCDFEGNDLSNVQGRGEECSGQCASTDGCTHFSWTSWNGGTCWMKSGQLGAQIGVCLDAGLGAVCGIKA